MTEVVQADHYFHMRMEGDFIVFETESYHDVCGSNDGIVLYQISTGQYTCVTAIGDLCDLRHMKVWFKYGCTLCYYDINDPGSGRQEITTLEPYSLFEGISDHGAVFIPMSGGVFLCNQGGCEQLEGIGTGGVVTVTDDYVVHMIHVNGHHLAATDLRTRQQRILHYNILHEHYGYYPDDYLTAAADGPHAVWQINVPGPLSHVDYSGIVEFYYGNLDTEADPVWIATSDQTELTNDFPSTQINIDDHHDNNDPRIVYSTVKDSGWALMVYHVLSGTYKTLTQTSEMGMRMGNPIKLSDEIVYVMNRCPDDFCEELFYLNLSSTSPPEQIWTLGGESTWMWPAFLEPGRKVGFAHHDGNEKVQRVIFAQGPAPSPCGCIVTRASDAKGVHLNACLVLLPILFVFWKRCPALFQHP